MDKLYTLYFMRYKLHVLCNLEPIPQSQTVVGAVRFHFRVKPIGDLH